MKYGRVTLLAGLALGGFLAATEMRADEPLPVLSSERLPLRGVKEPSGVCYHPARKTMFVVDDGGTICEFTPQGEIIRQKKIRSADFEGLTLDPASGLLYVAIEGEEIILEVDPETLEPRREFSLPREFKGRTVMKAGGQGIEAIAFVPDKAYPQGGTFFVANQCFNPRKHPEDISALFEVELPLKARPGEPGQVNILRCLRTDQLDLAALSYDPGRNLLFVISDVADRLLACSLEGKVLAAWTIPGEEQEGLAFDADGFLYIAQDTGGVLKLKLGEWNVPK